MGWDGMAWDGMAWDFYGSMFEKLFYRNFKSAIF